LILGVILDGLIEIDTNDAHGEELLYQDISQLIEGARNKALHQVGKLNVLLYWHIGKRIYMHVLGNKRAVYGSATLLNISKKLQARYGRGFGRRNIERSIQFVREYPEKEVINALCSHLKWTHFVSLLSIDDPLKRDFYAEMCRIERWSTRFLNNKVASMLFERTALAKKPEEIIRSEIEILRETNELSPDWVMQDPYIFENLFSHPLKDEKTLEDAIINDIEKFLMSMGNGFAFLERQKVIEVDGEFFKIDLLFYHRKLKRLILIELKQGRFKAADKGQVELYLRWLEKHEMQLGENKPIGIIMCSQKSEEHVELLELDNSSIRVAQFLSELPPKEIFELRLHEAVKRARERFEDKKLLDEE
jgi:predicted nuclease of restriction endonuclease-like (RecB) superfamily